MSDRASRSPRLARALMGALLPREEREFVIGDLEESFGARMTAGASARSARRWDWRAALSGIASFRRRGAAGPASAHAIRRKGDSVITNILRDIRFGARSLRRTPSFAVVAILTLALGIGANTAIFTVTHALLLKPLPYDRPDELTIVTENNLSRGWASFSVSPANFLDWRRQNTSFAALAAYGGRALNFSGSGSPERLRALAGTEGFLEMLGGSTVAGRLFQPEDFTDGHAVVILNDGFWQRAFGSRRDIVNQSITLNGQPYTVVGVMHPGWRFGGKDIDVFVPRAFDADERQRRGSHYLSVVGRLKPGATIDQARTEFNTLASSLDNAYPDTNKGWGITMTALLDAAVGDVRPTLFVLLGAVGLVLLVACANLANMHLARATVRAREIAIRAAIGAGRGRIVAQLLTECVMLALAGGVLGSLLAYWAVTALVAAYPTLLPRSSDIGLDLPVLVFTGGLSIATAILFGVVPAVSASRTDLTESLKEGGRTGASRERRVLRGALVVAEVALALVLLTGAGILLRSFLQISHVAPGFETDHRLAATTLLPQPKYDSAERTIAFYDAAITRLQALPGVEAVALTSTVPISGEDEIYSLAFEGRPPLPPGQGVSALYYLVNPTYFKTMGIPLLRGRVFADGDRATAPHVAIVNDVFVRLHFPNEDPIGQRIHIGRNSDVIREIVGVVGAVKHYGLDDASQAQVYEPFAQMPTQGMSFVIKTLGEPTALTATVRREILAVDADQPVTSSGALATLVDDSLAMRRVQTLLLGVFAGLALLLAAVGLYGVMAYAVSQRTQEIGLRMALGAGRGTVLGMVLRQAILLVGSGLAIGLAGAVLLGRVLATTLQPLLFHVTPFDVPTLIVVAAVLAVAGLLASFVPARRATKVDPIQALRS